LSATLPDERHALSDDNHFQYSEILNGCKVHLEAYAGEARELLRERRELQDCRDLLPGKKVAYSGYQHARIQAEEALIEVRERLSKAERSADVDRALLMQLDSAIGSLNRAKESLASTEASFEQQTTAIAELKKQLDGAIVPSGAARAEATEAQRVLEAARIAAGAAAIASHLHAGDDCPICQRELPASFVAPRDADLTTAISRESQARATTAKADDRVSTVRAQHEASQRQIDDCRTRLETARATLEEAISAIPTGV
jgi:exonuclease SbcC